MKTHNILKTTLLTLTLTLSNAKSQEIPFYPEGITNAGKYSHALDYHLTKSFGDTSTLTIIYDIPEIEKTQSKLPQAEEIYLRQNQKTLGYRSTSKQEVGKVLDLSPLQKRSGYKKAEIFKIKISTMEATEISQGLQNISAAYKNPKEKSTDEGCTAISLSVKQRIQMDPSEILNIVENEVSSNQNCACEIVKTAIRFSGEDTETIANIVETAILSAPEHIRMISQCAIAAMPKALPEIQEVLAKLDVNAGDTYLNDSKSGKEAVASATTPPTTPPNPLDIPGGGFPPEGGSRQRTTESSPLPTPRPFSTPLAVTDPNPAPGL